MGGGRMGGGDWCGGGWCRCERGVRGAPYTELRATTDFVLGSLVYRVVFVDFWCIWLTLGLLVYM